jgi:hypothetical protein
MIVRFSLPAKQRARLLQERREAQKAADVFARVCEEGDATRLCHAAQLLNECVDAWRPAMAKVARLSRVSPDVQNAFLDVWIESKTLRVAAALRGCSSSAIILALRLRYIAARGVMNAGASCTALRGPPISMSPESLQGRRQCQQSKSLAPTALSRHCALHSKA